MKCQNGQLQPDNFEYEYEKFVRVRFPEIGLAESESLEVTANRWLQALSPEKFYIPQTPKAEAVLSLLQSRFLELIQNLDGNHHVALGPEATAVHVSQALDFYTKMLIWIGRNYDRLDKELPHQPKS